VAGASDVALAAITFWAISSRCRIRKNAGRFATFRILANAATGWKWFIEATVPWIEDF